MLAPALAALSAALVCAADAYHAEAQNGTVAETAAAAVAERPAREWFALPLLFWLPETKVGFAATGGFHFKVAGSRRASNAFLVAGYTLEKQGSVDLSSDVYLRSGTLLTARLRAVHYPDAFYGIGSRTTDEGRELYTRRFLELATTVELPALRGRLRAGPRLVGRAEEIRDVRPGGVLDSSDLPGANGFRALGVGASVTWDTRDQPLWPSRGAFAQAYYVRHPGWLSTTGGFGKGALDLRLFRPVRGARVLGLGLVVENADGDAPFSLLSKLGSTRFLRGYREGRFRDRLAWAAQAELRVPIAMRVWGTAFGAFGDVARDPSLRADALKAAGGLGARFRLTDEGANLRLDVAVGRAGPEVYVLLLEAF